jgi:hypothetical protein
MYPKDKQPPEGQGVTRKGDTSPVKMMIAPAAQLSNPKGIKPKAYIHFPS